MLCYNYIGIPVGTPSVSNAILCSPSSVGPDSCSVACGDFGYFQVPRIVPVMRCLPGMLPCNISEERIITFDYYCNAPGQYIKVVHGLVHGM